MSRRGPLVRDHGTAVLLGLAAITLGAYLIYDAYEGRGRQRPFWLKFAPGP
jgi:hypothetical protein